MSTPRFSLRAMFLLIAALCLLLAFPRYFVLVAALFFAVLGVLALISFFWMGPLDQAKLDEYRRLSSSDERDEHPR